MALFEKGNKIGNRFSSDNQPQNSGRKPSVYKYIKDITGKKVAPEMSKEDYYNPFLDGKYARNLGGVG